MPVVIPSGYPLKPVVLKVDHHIHSPFEKSLMGRKIDTSKMGPKKGV
jgi:hypothetical protein